MKKNSFEEFKYLFNGDLEDDSRKEESYAQLIVRSRQFCNGPLTRDQKYELHSLYFAHRKTLPRDVSFLKNEEEQVLLSKSFDFLVDQLEPSSELNYLLTVGNNLVDLDHDGRFYRFRIRALHSHPEESLCTIKWGTAPKFEKDLDFNDKVAEQTLNKTLVGSDAEITIGESIQFISEHYQSRLVGNY